jgi:SAM-dependent methyltransferase
MPERRVKRSFFIPIEQRLSVDRTEEVACNLCGSNRYSSLGFEYEFEIRVCRECGLVYVSPQPTAEELPHFYEDFYEETSEEEAAKRTLGAVERHLARLIDRLCPRGGAFFEVGCGLGALLARLDSSRWELHALELSEAAAEFAAQRVPAARIQNATLEAADVRPASMDCVAAIAVLEHMKDPKEALARMTSWLKPGGALVIQVPYAQHFMRVKRLMPFLPLSFEAPRHLFDFSPSVLRRYFREQGLEGVHAEVARPFCARTRRQSAMIWAMKAPGILANHITGRGYVYPFAGAFVMYGRRK